MSDPVSRLLAAIEETERLAREAQSGPWECQDMPGEVREVGNGGTVAYVPLPADALHIVRNDPAAVLRRCASDRETVEEYRRELSRTDYRPGSGSTLGVLRRVVERIASTYEEA